MLWILLLCGAALFAVNRFRRAEYARIERTGPEELPKASGTLRLVTWNLGYAALGRRADLIVDGGRAVRALPRDKIAQGADQIAQQLAAGDWQVMCLQENAKPGFLTRGVDLNSRIKAALPGFRHVFWADMKTVLLPPPLSITHGMSTALAVRGDAGRVLPLPEAETVLAGALKKSYVALVHHLPIAGTDCKWVIYNLHLPVFKTTETKKAAQLAYLFTQAQQDYAQGHAVVIAGDWNTRLCDTDFPHTATPEQLDWRTDFPPQALPPGWQLITDPTVPSCRSIYEPYAPGQTYTSVLDGFCISPNVSATGVKTHDLGFAASDHHPVEACFRFDPELEKPATFRQGAKL